MKEFLKDPLAGPLPLQAFVCDGWEGWQRRDGRGDGTGYQAHVSVRQR